jgi:hypothetical protein
MYEEAEARPSQSQVQVQVITHLNVVMSMRMDLALEAGLISSSLPQPCPRPIVLCGGSLDLESRVLV